METPLPVAVVDKKTKTVWTADDILPRPCPTCGAKALVQLTGALLKAQPDGTNIVCTPASVAATVGSKCPR